MTSFQQKQNGHTGQVKDKKDINFDILLRIPNVGTLPYDLKSQFTKIFYKESNIEIFSFFITNKLSEFFLLKSQKPKAITSNVVYKFTCLFDTGLSYIHFKHETF